jgi:hypothetical protein
MDPDGSRQQRAFSKKTRGRENWLYREPSRRRAADNGKRNTENG